jgi:hypothetical protein
MSIIGHPIPRSLFDYYLKKSAIEKNDVEKGVHISLSIYLSLLPGWVEPALANERWQRLGYYTYCIYCCLPFLIWDIPLLTIFELLIWQWAVWFCDITLLISILVVTSMLKPKRLRHAATPAWVFILLVSILGFLARIYILKTFFSIIFFKPPLDSSIRCFEN